MNKKQRKLILLSLLIFIIIGCTSKDIKFVTYQNDQSSSSNWSGIIPGRSTKEEVFQTITVNEMIDQATVQQINRKGTDYSDCIAFNTKENQKGYVFICFNDDIVQSINLDRYYIYLKELIDYHGKPDNVVFEISGTNIRVSFLYSEQNIWASFTTLQFLRSKLNISPLTQVESIDYLSDLAFNKRFDRFSTYFLKYDDLKPFVYQSWKDYGFYQLPPIYIND